MLCASQLWSGLATNNKRPLLEVPMTWPTQCLLLCLQVKQDDGRLFCAGDDKFVEQATNRYMATVRVADLTGQVYPTVFNDQVGMAAAVVGGRLHALFMAAGLVTDVPCMCMLEVDGWQ